MLIHAEGIHLPLPNYQDQILLLFMKAVISLFIFSNLCISCCHKTVASISEVSLQSKKMEEVAFSYE